MLYPAELRARIDTKTAQFMPWDVMEGRNIAKRLAGCKHSTANFFLSSIIRLKHPKTLSINLNNHAKGVAYESGGEHRYSGAE
jgi:hypothetical protein